MGGYRQRPFWPHRRAGQHDLGGYKAGAPTHETSLEAWDFMLNLNALTAFIISRAVLPQMLQQGSGRIIHTAACAALAGTANHSAYNASKSVVVRLVESMAAEYKHLGITVNCVLPGTIDTPQTAPTCPTPTGASGCRPPRSPTPLSS